MSKPLAPPRLSVLDDTMAVCRLDADAGIPAWATTLGFYSVTRTAEELSVVCAAEHVPEGVAYERGWRAFEVGGPLDFSLAGVLSGVTAPLAEVGVPVFVISTHDADYVLVGDGTLDFAVAALRGAGHEIV